MRARRLHSYHALALILYLLFSLLLTFPLILHFGSHVPGDGIDDPALAWNLWWIKFSLVDRQLNPFPSGWMFYPLSINLAFYTLTILNGLLSVPLQTAWSLVPASNLMLLSSFVLSGYGAFLLALHVLAASAGARQPQAGGGRWRYSALIAAFIAGLLYAFASSKLFYAALGQFNIASSQWIPFCILYVLRSGRPSPRLREPLLAALFLLLQAYAELTYATFLLIFIAIFVLYRFGQIASGSRRPAWHQANNSQTPRSTPAHDESRAKPKAGWSGAALLLRNLAFMALVVAIGIAPFLANMLPDMRAEGDFFVEGTGFADIFSADLAGYLLPTQLHPLLGGIVRQTANDSQTRPDGRLWQVNKGQHLFIGYVALALAVAGLGDGIRRRRRELGFWALAAFLFFLLTLGPTVRIAGLDTGIPGPFRLLQGLPFLKGNRYPSRYSVMLLISLAPLVAMGTTWLLDSFSYSKGRPAERKPGCRGVWRLSAAGFVLAGVLLFEHLSLPLPLSDMSVPTIYQIIANDPHDVAVLDLPLGWRNGFSVFGKQDVIIMFEQWWQTRHEKPILGGNTSRNPEHKFRYFLEAPLIGPLTVLANADDQHPHIQAQLADALKALQAGDPGLGGNDMLLSAMQAAPDVLSTLNIGYVVVHKDRVPPELVAFVEDYLPVELLAQTGQHVLYAVIPREPRSELLLYPAREPLSRGEGWSGVANARFQPAGADDSPEIAPVLWAERRDARLFLPPLQPGARQITVRAKAAGPGQSLRLWVNGYETMPQPLPETWTELSFDLPAGALGSTRNEVRLRFGQTYPIEALLPAEGDDTAQAQSTGPLSLLVESAGLEAGNYGHIWLNGEDVSPGGRGYNLAIIDGRSARLRAAASFDTHGDPDASQELLVFLKQLAEGDLLAVAVKDTASDQLSQEAALALEALGLTNMRGRFRWGQAAIVLMGAGQTDSATVIEEISGLRGVSVGWGPGWRKPRVAAAVEWLHATTP